MVEFENIKCNLCGSNNYKIIIRNKYDKEKQKDLKIKFRSSGDETLIDQVVKCNKCGLMYINPRITSNNIIKGYSEGKDEAFVSQEEGRIITFKRCLKVVKKYKKKGKILDIGTAGGTFLNVAKKDGWSVYGIEPNKWLCEWSKKNYNINIKQGTLLDHKFENEFFDVITLWDVLEHVTNPKRILEECYRILKSDGIIVINYPNVGSWISKVMRSKWIFLLSVHLYYFTPKTIRSMLKKTGFSIIETKPHFQTLQLGYLMFRMKEYSKLLHKLGYKAVNILRMKNFQVPYWLGQTLVIARKNEKK